MRCPIGKALLAATLFIGFGVAPSSASDLVIAMPNWPSGQVSANIMKVVIKDEFD